ncbi:MAG: FliI/YscN family ATPase [Candidatus Fibromonas sp.]|jgi:flagellum-specific ATP synthase|nr:FliI/YscN family ATPase [Candidatus Fibromonas sp.]
MNKLEEISHIRLADVRGRVVKIIGLVIECEGPNAGIGELCVIEQNGKVICLAEVVGFRETRTLVMPLGALEGIRPGMSVVAKGKTLTAPVGYQLLGRVLDGMGNAMDNLGEIKYETRRSIYATPPTAMQRARIKEPMYTGIRAIDGFLTIGRGQRMGIFAGSGVGKSVTMGMIARNCLAKVNVIALIGERGREVREFIEKDLGPEGLKRSVVIVATSDQPALVRLKASFLAMSIAEYFRDSGDDVFFLMDSSTRLAMAQREIGLAVGEPPATKGYTPSVFAFLPKLFERAGNSDKGSITGLYTVLVDGDDLEDPIADTVRSILDGHIVLSRALANKNHYPAVDILASISRCRTDIASPQLKELSATLLRSLAVYRKNEDLINIGAYAKGSDPEVDVSIKRHVALDNFLVQGIGQSSKYEETEAAMKEIAGIA